MMAPISKRLINWNCVIVPGYFHPIFNTLLLLFLSAIFSVSILNGRKLSSLLYSCTYYAVSMYKIFSSHRTQNWHFLSLQLVWAIAPDFQTYRICKCASIGNSSNGLFTAFTFSCQKKTTFFTNCMVSSKSSLKIIILSSYQSITFLGHEEAQVIYRFV